MTTDAPLTIETRFGSLTAGAGDVVTFVAPMPGFPGCRQFVLASAPSLAPFTSLNGLDEPRPSFLAIDPHLVQPGYQVTLDDNARRQLDLVEGEPLLWLALVRVRDDAALVNLRAPIVINPRRMSGLQLVPHDSAYSTDHLLPLD